MSTASGVQGEPLPNFLALARYSESAFLAKGARSGYAGGMGYAILRIQKLKSAVAVHRSMKHSFRAQETPNADPTLAHENTHIGAQSVAEGMAAFRARLPAKHRKDAVQCIEYLMTASPDAMKGKSRAEQDAYFRDALEWLRARHGAENVVYAGIHRDETTPHMYAYVVPLDANTGRLNAKKWLGGARALRDMQTSFAHDVGAVHGLERGVEGSKAKHQTIKKYYARVNGSTPEQQQIEVPEPGLKDRLNPAEYGQRVAQAVVQQLQPVQRALQAKVREYEAQRERMQQAEKTAQEATKKRREADAKIAGMVGNLQPFMQLAVEDREAFEGVKAQTQRKLHALEQKAEQKRRIEALRALEGASGGAAYTFAKNALAAIHEAGGDAGKVDWSKVEQQSFNEAVQQHGQDRIEAVQALLEHSPGAVRPERKRGLEATIEKLKTQGHKPHEPARGKDRGPELSR